MQKPEAERFFIIISNTNADPTWNVILPIQQSADCKIPIAIQNQGFKILIWNYIIILKYRKK